MFEGQPSTMLRSLDNICELPSETLLWPGQLCLHCILDWCHNVNVVMISQVHPLCKTVEIFA